MKYKNNIITLIFGVCISTLFYLHFSKEEKIVYMNDIMVNQKYQGMIDAREIIQQKSKIGQANIDTLTSELQQAIMVYEKSRTKLSDNERKLNEQLLNSKQQQLVQYRDAIQKKSEDEQQKIVEEVSKKMNRFMEKYAKTQNYKLVLGSSILYGTPEIDITQNVIDGLNSEYKK